MTAAAAVSAAMVAAGMLGIGVAVAQDPPAKPERVEDGQWCTEMRPDRVQGGRRLVPRMAVCFQRRDQLLAWQLREERDQAAEIRRENRRLRRALAHDPTVAEALTIASVVYGIPRRSLSTAAWCESRHRPDARNGIYRGLFQQGPMFEATPFGRAGLSVWSPYAAALSAAYTVRAQGWRQWDPRCRP